MTPQERDAYVAEKLGIDGWERWPICAAPSHKKQGLDPLHYVCDIHGCVNQCIDLIPPPNLRSLEGMSKVLIALLERGYGIDNAYLSNIPRPVNWPDVVADAAYKAMERDPK